MASAGIDLLRGRPTPAIGTTEAKLQQRKLDALERGIHRIADIGSLPYGVHLVGIGGAGARVIEQVLRDAPDDLLSVEGSRLCALSIDIGDGAPDSIEQLARRFPAERAQVDTLALPMPGPDALQDSLLRVRDFLKLEYPMYHWNEHYEPWLDAGAQLPKAGQRIPRAVAKALYTRAYYDAERPLAQALRRFARSVEATRGDAVVCIVFGLGGGTGSGIALDLARHLSNVMFGRRVLVAGLAIAPCEGDPAEHAGANLYPVLNELDVLCDETKNKGVVLSCGDLYKNPFTAGVLVVPQEPVWQGTKSLAATHRRVDQEIASLLTLRRGANLWEALRLLNWVAAPSTQHSAARTPWGAKWIHLCGYADVSGVPVAVGPQLPKQFGLLPGYVPEFIEMRVADAAHTGTAPLAASLQSAFAPEVAPHAAEGGRDGSVQFMLPRVAKTDLNWFHEARDAYDTSSEAKRLRDHALLLEQGVLLCEPSTRIEGMAGAGIGQSQQWIAVSLDELRGQPDAQPLARAA